MSLSYINTREGIYWTKILSIEIDCIYLKGILDLKAKLKLPLGLSYIQMVSTPETLKTKGEATRSGFL